jgi:Na+-transporting NADH:ubiquinone oxidoreductase subunit NqrC
MVKKIAAFLCLTLLCGSVLASQSQILKMRQQRYLDEQKAKKGIKVPPVGKKDVRKPEEKKEEEKKEVPPVSKLATTDASKAALEGDDGARVNFMNDYVNPLQVKADPATDMTLDMVKTVASTAPLAYTNDDKGAKEFAGNLVAVFEKMVTTDKVDVSKDPGLNWKAYVDQVKKLALAIK